MDLGFSGTSDGLTPEQVESLVRLVLQLHRATPFEYAHHGDCVGADAEFDSICWDAGLATWIHPTGQQWVKPQMLAHTSTFVVADPPAHPLKRNRRIVEASHTMIFCPDGYAEKLRDGVWATYRYTRRAPKLWWFIWPNGQTTYQTLDRSA